MTVASRSCVGHHRRMLRHSDELVRIITQKGLCISPRHHAFVISLTVMTTSSYSVVPNEVLAHLEKGAGWNADDVAAADDNRDLSCNLHSAALQELDAAL